MASKKTTEKSSKKVLIIDDDQFFCQVYQTEIPTVDQTVEVICENDGKAGLAKARAWQPDLILLDLVMGEYDGFWFLKERKKDEKVLKIPVVAISGLAQMQDVGKLYDLGVKMFYSKLAVDPSRLAQSIVAWLQKGTHFDEEAKITDIASLKEGQQLNTIFSSASEEIQKILSQFLKTEISIGELQATVAPIASLQKYLAKFTTGQQESTVVYSVMDPPISAALILIPNATIATLLKAVEKSYKRKTAGQIAGILNEIYNIMANTFFNTATQFFHSQKIFKIRPSMLSTPDLVLKVLRKDGFLLEKSKFHFLFRQTYNLGTAKLQFDFIILLTTEGLRQLGGGDWQVSLKQ
jgi:two-component system, cell cycle response regulator DivK